MKKKIIFVGLSGGVDSAVSAALLKKQGYEVVGVFIKTWHPDFLVCNEEGERRDAMRVAAHLDIPFLTFDLEEVYKKEVVDYMIREYKRGRTPNPDVMCNKEVKFGAFLKKALSMGADFVATGHYSIKKNSKNFPAFALGDKRTANPRLLKFLNFSLAKGVDPSKDQAYFLWTLKQEQLKKILFPIGHLKKTEVRKLAKKLNLPIAEKKDSQGICFLGAVDLKDFLKHYIVAKDVKKNILTVSQNRDISYSSNLKSYKIENTNWINENPKANKEYTAQIRYHGEFLPCKVKIISKTKAEILFSKAVLVASGQSCVVYDRRVCLGGGGVK